MNRPWVAPALLALLTAGMTLYLARWGILNHSWGPDEELYRHFAGGMSRDFGLLLHMDPAYGRGIQRLHLLLMAVPMALFKNPHAFQLAHFLFAAVYASAAIPAWLIARGSGLAPLTALVPAVLVVLTPWSVVTTSFLAESVAYGLFAWALWAIWRAAVRPSIPADILAVVVMCVAVLAHTGFLLLFPALPIVAVAQAWRYATGDGPAAARLRRLPLAALRRQPLAVGLGLLGGLVLALAWTRLLPGGPERFTGSYSTHLPPLWLMASKWRSFLSRVDAGTGFLMFAAALPWLIARIARPREPALHALAWTMLLASCAVLVALVGGPADERYVMYMGFTIPLVGSVALLRAQLGPVMALIGAAAAFALYFTPGWRLVDPTDFGYFGYPIEEFMNRVVLHKLQVAVPSVDSRTSAAVLLALVLIGLVGLAAIPRLRRGLPVAVAFAAFFQMAASGYAINKHVNTVGAHHGTGLTARSFVDVHVPGGEQVGLLAVSNGLTFDYRPVWREVQYWNVTTRSVVKIISPITFFDGGQAPFPFGTHDIEAALDLTTGQVQPSGRWPFPRYLVIPQPPLSVVLDWEKVTQGPHVPATLVRVKRPLQARSTLGGVKPDGFTIPGTPATITVYPGARPAVRCIFADLLTPELDRPRPGVGLRFSVAHDGMEIAKGKVMSGKLERVYMPVNFDGPTTSFTIRTFGQVEATGRKLPIQIGSYEPLPTACPQG